MTSPIRLNDQDLQKDHMATPPKPSIVSPVKQCGKLSYGFRGFKLVNSSIKLLKQGDVKATNPKELNPAGSGKPMMDSQKTKLSTADALKQIRERIQQRKKIQEEMIANEKSNDPHMGDGIETKEANGPEKFMEDRTENKCKDSPTKSSKSETVETKSRRPSDRKSADAEASSSYNSHRHRNEQRKSRSPHREHTSKRDRSSSSRKPSDCRRTKDYRFFDMRDHRQSAPRSSKRRSKSRDDSRSYYSGHKSRGEKRKSWDSDTARHGRSRDSQSQHRKHSPRHKSSSDKRSSTESEGTRRMTDGEESGDTSNKRSSLVNYELEANEHGESPDRKSESEESEYVVRSGCSSVDDEESETNLCPERKEGKHFERDGLFSKLSEFTSSDRDEVDTVGNASTNKHNCKNKKDTSGLNLLTTHSLSLVAKLYSDDKSSDDSYVSGYNHDETGNDEIETYSAPQSHEHEKVEDSPFCSSPQAKEVVTDNGDAADVCVLSNPEGQNELNIEVLQTNESSGVPDPVPAGQIAMNAYVHTEHTHYPQPMLQGEPQFSSCSSASTPLLDEPPTPPYSPLGDELSKDDDRSWQDPPPIRTEVDTGLPSALPEDDRWHGLPLKPTEVLEEADGCWQDSRNKHALDDSIKHVEPATRHPAKMETPESKIPVLASHLKTVFESLLKTDFPLADTAEVTTVPKLNGLVTTTADCAATVHRGTDSSRVGTEITAEAQVDPGAHEQLNNIDDQKTESAQDLVTMEESSGATISEITSPASPSASSFIKAADLDCVTPIVSTPDRNSVSPRPSPSSVSPCSNKLKLHATTKTPLPAKKSYIQQAQISNELQPAAGESIPPGYALSDTTTDSIHATSQPESAVSGIGNNALPTVAGLSEPDLPNRMTVEGSSVGMLEGDSDQAGVDMLTREANAALVLGSTLGMLRQDSSGSSPAEADDEAGGPRRSARIKTKKEKTKSARPKLVRSVSDAGSMEPPSGPDTGGEIKLAPADDSSVGKPTSQAVANKRITSELSESDLFKVKINLAEGTDDVPDKFDVLEENLYFTAKKKSRARKEIRRMVCECALEETPVNGACCGENCLNRLLMIECSSRCEFGDNCTNKRFQQRIYAPTEVFKTDFKGWGIRAADGIKPGQLVMEYCGEVVDHREFIRRSLEYSESNHAHFYFMALSQDEVIDATYKGNASRFINHSCEPNAETQKWTVNGRLRVGFFTIRDIPKGEEITFDYQFERYGKVAQKCYCGAPKCRGYLGRAPDDDDKKSNLLKKWSQELPLGAEDVIDSNEKEKKKNKKKLDIFEDDTMEKDLSKLLGGLRSSKEVLTLSRLMVRCDTHSQRVMCMRVLKETTSQTRLKTFLQFHGLSIIWSWMVEITATEDDNAQLLKLEIIETLSKLPITNRNVIEDSKVLSVVQRWAKNGTDEKVVIDDEGEVVEEKKEDATSDSPRTENAEEVSPASVDKPEAAVEDDKSEEKEERVEVKITSTGDDTATGNDTVQSTEIGKETSSDDDSKDGIKPTEAVKETNKKVLSAAATLLDSWKDLREIYRIPKRPKPATSPDSSSRDNSHSRTSSPLPKHCKTDDSDPRGRGGSQERWRDSLDRSWDSDRNWHRDKRKDSRSSPVNYEGRWESGRRKRRFSTDSDEQSLNGKNVPWHCRPPQNSRFETKMSRQEYRRKFEKDVKKREQEKKRLVEEASTPAPLMSVQFPGNNPQVAPDLPVGVRDVPVMGQDVLLMGQDMQMVGQPMPATEPLFTPSGYSGNLIQINPSPSPQIIMQPYVEQGVNQQLNALSQMMTVVHPTQHPFSMQMPVQQEYAMPQVYSQEPAMQVSYGIPGQNLPVSQHQMNALEAPIMANPITMQQQPTIQQQPSVQQPLPQTSQPQQQTQPSNLTILGSQNGQAIVLLTAEQLKKLTQDQGSSSAPQESVAPSNPSASASSKPKKKEKSSKADASSTSTNKNKSKSSTKLPPNWKSAKDPEGRTYYYHVITRQTQWDPPTWDGKEEDMVGKKEAEMDLSSTPTYDERRHKSSRDKGEKITDEGKKAKETFRLKMSQFVVQCLGSFRKNDCKVGRITSTEDFKHLARKLTHNIMLKEIKLVRVWEDLDFNTNVRHKTKEYVKKYMNRVGPVYRIRDDNPMDPS